MHSLRLHTALVFGLIFTLCATLRAQSDEALYAALAQDFEGELRGTEDVANAKKQLWQRWADHPEMRQCLDRFLMAHSKRIF